MKPVIYILVFLLLTGYATASSMINISRTNCWEWEDVATSGYPDGTNLCDTPANIDIDDGQYESTGTRPNNYAGVRTSHNYAFPSSCNILSVEACVDFYFSNLNTCTGVQVTRTGGTSWSLIPGATCPTSDQGIVCYDVTSLLSWSCSDFASSQSEIYIEGSYSGNSPLQTDYVSMHVNYTSNPNITQPVIVPTNAYNDDTLNCSVTPTDAEDNLLTVNFTWYQNGVLNTSYDASVSCVSGTSCFTSVGVPGLTIGHNWTCSAIAFDGDVSSPWRNSSTVTVLNREPILENVTVNSNNSINLLAGNNLSVNCNGTVTEYDGFSDISYVNATFFSASKSASSPDNRSNHYTNTSCSLTSNPGSEQYYSCVFDVDYYALNGTWHCEVNVVDNNSSIHTLSSSIEINPLTAIGVSLDVFDYGQLSVLSTSAEKPLDIINFGNIPMDVSFYAYGDQDDDGLAMGCEEGSIPLDYHRYDLVSGLDFAQLSPVTGKSSPSYLDLNLSQTVYGGSQEAKSLYFRLQIPVSRRGVCKGKMVFTAIPD